MKSALKPWLVVLCLLVLTYAGAAGAAPGVSAGRVVVVTEGDPNRVECYATPSGRLCWSIGDRSRKFGLHAPPGSGVAVYTRCTARPTGRKLKNRIEAVGVDLRTGKPRFVRWLATRDRGEWGTAAVYSPERRTLVYEREEPGLWMVRTAGRPDRQRVYRHTVSYPAYPAPVPMRAVKLAWAPGGRYLAALFCTLDPARTIEVLDRSWRPIKLAGTWLPRDWQGDAYGFTWSRDGRLFAAWGQWGLTPHDTNWLCVYDVRRHTRLYQGTFQNPKRAVYDAALSPAGDRVAVVLGEAVWVLSLRSGEWRWVAGGPKEHRRLCWSPDGRQVAVVTRAYDRSRSSWVLALRAVDVATGRAMNLIGRNVRCADVVWVP